MNTPAAGTTTPANGTLVTDPLNAQWHRLDECAAASAQMIQWYAPKTWDAIRQCPPDPGIPENRTRPAESVFWDDLADDLGNRKFRRIFRRESRRIAKRDRKAAAGE